jgi:hypothetical protein
MELFILLLALVVVDIALWRGWGADSREPDTSWAPGAHSRRSAEGVPDRLDPAQSHLADGHPHVVPC